MITVDLDGVFHARKSLRVEYKHGAPETLGVKLSECGSRIEITNREGVSIFVCVPWQTRTYEVCFMHYYVDSSSRVGKKHFSSVKEIEKWVNEQLKKDFNLK